MQCDVGMVFLGRRERISMEEARQLAKVPRSIRLTENSTATAPLNLDLLCR